MTPTQQIAARTLSSHPAYEQIARLMNGLLLGSPAFSVAADVGADATLSVTIKGPLGVAILLIAYDQDAVDLANAPVAEGPAN